MKVGNEHLRSIRVAADGETVEVIDQTRLPHELHLRRLDSLDDACAAIRDMVVRGAPLIGVTAAYGVYLALRERSGDAALGEAIERLAATRPTAVNLRWALERQRRELEPLPDPARAAAAFAFAGALAEEDVATNRAIGTHGLEVIRRLAADKPPGEPVNVLTHCNAGWLATVDWGTATAPVYLAQDAGIDLRVWVSETRPRNQGAALTAWELGQRGVAHRLVVDNVAGHLMQHGMIDLCLVGSDRTTRCGDVCNKVGTYLKALAAADNGLPFYVCLPGSTIDWNLDDGIAGIPIEQRDADEVLRVGGRTDGGKVESVAIAPPATTAVNYAFDVTPAKWITGLITERGIVTPSAESLARAFPEFAGGAVVQ